MMQRQTEKVRKKETNRQRERKKERWNGRKKEKDIDRQTKVWKRKLPTSPMNSEVECVCVRKRESVFLQFPELRVRIKVASLWWCRRQELLVGDRALCPLHYCGDRLYDDPLLHLWRPCSTDYHGYLGDETRVHMTVLNKRTTEKILKISPPAGGGGEGGLRRSEHHLIPGNLGCSGVGAELRCAVCVFSHVVSMFFCKIYK